MSSDFDKMVDQIQKKIMDDMRKVYSEEVIELFLHPKNVGEIKDPEGYGKFKETNFRIAHMGDRTLEEVKKYLKTIDDLTQ